MYKIIQLVFMVLIANIFSEVLLACSVPMPGYMADRDSLIMESSEIYLIKVKNTNETGMEYEFEIIDTLYGNKKSVKPQYRDSVASLFASDSKQTDFNGHQDQEFWLNNIGRSDFPCCICGPAHTFEEGITYLYFPNMLGAMKSAEIIKSESDLWYQYVVEKIKDKKRIEEFGGYDYAEKPNFDYQASQYAQILANGTLLAKKQNIKLYKAPLYGDSPECGEQPLLEGVFCMGTNLFIVVSTDNKEAEFGPRLIKFGQADDWKFVKWNGQKVHPQFGSLQGLIVEETIPKEFKESATRKKFSRYKIWANSQYFEFEKMEK